MSNKLPELEYTILRIMAEYDCYEEIFWNTLEEDGHVRFIVKCSDFFAWACADGEDLETGEDVENLERAIFDVGWLLFNDKDRNPESNPYKDAWSASYCNAEYGCLLYCARKRKCRPQGAYYKHIPREIWPLFDECGPEREPGMFNPHPRPSEVE